MRSRLRAAEQLDEFLREHQPDVFSRRYAQCYPPAQHYLNTGGKARERLYNFMDVSRALCSSAVTLSLICALNLPENQSETGALFGQVLDR